MTIFVKLKVLTKYFCFKAIKLHKEHRSAVISEIKLDNKSHIFKLLKKFKNPMINMKVTSNFCKFAD